jgi:hypothetical protein
VVFAGDLGYAVVLGTGTGTFGRATLFRETTTSFGALVGDFNNDGTDDFTGTGGIFGHTYLGNGDGTFRGPIDAGAAAQSGNGISGDFNGDGNIDFVIPSATPRQDGSNYGFKIAVGAGDGTFSAYIGYVLSQNPIGNPIVGDFNADGLADLAIQVNGQLHVMTGDRLRWLAGDLYTSPYVNPGMLFGADLDGNGSTDLVVGNSRDFTVFRNTHGVPALLAQVTLSPAFAIGGRSTSGLVQLGGPAPAEGAVVTLTSSNPALASVPATVTVAAGAASATFDIATSAVDAAGAATVTAAFNGVEQAAALSVLPAYTLTGLSINPGSQYGIFTVQGTLTLSNPADTSAVVQLSSANPAVASVPASVTVPAGATSVDFTIALRAVTADTLVTITATRGDVSLNAPITVLKPADTVAITRALLTQKISELRVEATSTSATATINAYNAATGALLGTLDNAGGGKYKGAFFLFVPANAPAPSIVLKSSLGGTTSAVAQLK